MSKPEDLVPRFKLERLLNQGKPASGSLPSQPAPPKRARGRR